MFKFVRKRLYTETVHENQTLKAEVEVLKQQVKTFEERGQYYANKSSEQTRELIQRGDIIAKFKKDLDEAQTELKLANKQKTLADRLKHDVEDLAGRLENSESLLVQKEQAIEELRDYRNKYEEEIKILNKIKTIEAERNREMILLIRELNDKIKELRDENTIQATEIQALNRAKRPYTKRK
jgi:cell division protein FtsB